MCKSFRQKIQSLNKNQQNTLVVILVLLDLFIVILLATIFITSKKPISSPVTEKESQEKEIPQEVIEKLSAPPSGKSEEVPEEVLKNLSAPKK